MKLEELKNWEKLNKREQARLKKVYSEIGAMTKTLHDTKKRRGDK